MSDLFHILAQEIEMMARDDVKSELLHFGGHFPLDYTEEYLESLDTRKLRHILLAARLQLLEPQVKHYT